MRARPGPGATGARQAAYRVVEHGSATTDALVAGVLAASSLLALATGARAGIVTTPPPYRELDPVAVALVLGQVAPLVRMRRMPVAALAVAGAAFLLADLGRLPPLPADAAILLVLYVGVVKSRGRAVTFAVAALLGAAQWAVLQHLGVPVEQGLFRLGLGALIFTAATARRSLTAYAREVELDRARLERGQAEAVRALARHRAGLLRDLHDVVTHRLTTIVVQADAAQTRLPDRAATAESLAVLASIGREALEELRDLLAELQPDPATEGPGRPAPGLADLPGLLDLACPPGRRPRLRVHGEQHPLPAETQLAMYRIVQESVTNALRHTGDIPSTVTVRYGAGAVELEIESDPPAVRPVPPASAGRGTDGMRQRAAGLGGELVAGPRADGGYRVLTRLPDPGPGR